MIYRLGEFCLDTGRAELSGPGGPVALEPKAYDLLVLLVERRERLVTREEAIHTVWGGRFISDAAVSTVLKSLRKALGDDGTALLGGEHLEQTVGRLETAGEAVGVPPAETHADKGLSGPDLQGLFEPGQP